MRSLAALSIVLAGCAEPHVHVYLLGSEPELLAQDFRVYGSAYTADELSPFEFRADFRELERDHIPATDFVLTGEITEPVQLRVQTMALTKLMFADAVLDASTGETLELTLSAGERSLGIPIASFAGGGGSDLATLHTGGIVLAWVNEQGLQIRRDNDPDASGFGQPAVLDPMPGVTSVRLASRIELMLPYHPKVYAIAWLSGAGEPKLRVTSEAIDPQIKPIALSVPGSATDLRIAMAYENASFAVVSAVLVGNAIQLTTHNAAGDAIDSTVIGSELADGVRGVAVTNNGKILLGWRGGGRSHVWRIDGDTLDVATADKIQLDYELRAMALSPDTGNLSTFQVRPGNVLVNAIYETYSDLTNSNVVAELGPVVSGGEIGAASCLVSWPVRRSNTDDRIDLRYALLGKDGQPLGPSRLLNAEEEFDHIRPTALCGSDKRPFAVFLQQALREVPAGSLKLRRVPTGP